MILDDFIKIMIDLLNNAIILLALVFLYAATNYDTDTKYKSKRIIAGVVVGLSAIFVMSNPWQLSEGLFFDTRSVLFGITGVFFGLIPTLIGAIFGIIYRIYLGGGGVYAGVATILFTASFGLIWRHLNLNQYFKNRYLRCYTLGVILHVLTLLAFSLTPNPAEVIRNTMPAYLGLFPLITMIIGVVIENQKDRLFLNVEIKKQRTLLKASLDSTTTMEMYALNKDIQYIAFNEFHRKQMKNFYDIDIKEGDDYLAHIENPQMRLRLQRNIMKALSGDIFIDTSEVEVTPGKYIEERFTPILDEDQIVGVTIFSYEVTDRKKYEASILYLSYNDALTGLYNRRYYQEKILEVDKPEHLPLSVIQCDINGLKIMNDAFGHQAGDDLLIEVSKAFKQAFFDKGMVCRIGGDEFIAILPNYAYQQATYIVDKIKQNLEKKSINGMSISISYGVSTKTSDEAIEDVIRTAEEQMYKHKLFEVSSHRNESIKTILNTLHEKNPREEKHSKRVSDLCIMIGKKLNMKNDELNQLKAISNLHDIGKIAIDEAILNKPGKLTPEEWEVIKRHPEIGYRIISTSPEYAEIAYDILSHHEKYDGTGYPRGLKGEQIPIRARIISIADAFDAMVSERPYRKSLTVEEAVEEIKKNAGTQFDPKLVKIFLDLIAKNQLHL